MTEVGLTGVSQTLLFYPIDGQRTSLWNVDKDLPDYTASHFIVSQLVYYLLRWRKVLIRPRGGENREGVCWSHCQTSRVTRWESRRCLLVRLWHNSRYMQMRQKHTIRNRCNAKSFSLNSACLYHYRFIHGKSNDAFGRVVCYVEWFRRIGKEEVLGVA